jgi:hypothetical protein
MLLPNSIINELTPNIALMLMISTNEMGRWNNHDQPYCYLWSAIEHALEPGVLGFESAVRVGPLLPRNKHCECVLTYSRSLVRQLYASHLQLRRDLLRVR